MEICRYELCADIACLMAAFDRHAGTIVAAAALFVSWLAFRAAHLQAKTSQEQAKIAGEQAKTEREHNLLSVRPFLVPQANQTAGEGSVYEQINTYHGTIVVNLANVGLGPAIITRYEFHVDGQPSAITDSPSMQRAMVRASGLDSDDIEVEQTYMFRRMAAITPNDHILVTKFSVRVESAQRFEELKEQLLKRIRLVVDFQSAYGEKQPTFDSGNY